MNAGRITVAVGLALLAVAAVLALINGRSTIELGAYVVAIIGIVTVAAVVERRKAQP